MHINYLHNFDFIRRISNYGEEYKQNAYICIRKFAY